MFLHFHLYLLTAILGGHALFLGEAGLPRENLRSSAEIDTYNPSFNIEVERVCL